MSPPARLVRPGHLRGGLPPGRNRRIGRHNGPAPGQEGPQVLIFSMSVSADGFITDRNGDIGWGVPSEDQFRFHLEEVRSLGAVVCGRRLYETMVVWETDPALRNTVDEAAFADAWAAVPKIVFSSTLSAVAGNAR